MKALEELTREIREKLPRLKEPKALKKLGGIYIETFDSIMLNDVLEWLYIIYPETEYYVNTAGDFCENNLKRDYQEYLTTWNLSKIYLKDQSPELINFLHSLIKSKPC